MDIDIDELTDHEREIYLQGIKDWHRVVKMIITSGLIESILLKDKDENKGDDTE